MSTVVLRYTCEVVLRSRDIWQDGDEPEHVTEEDVLREIEKDGGILEVLDEWNLHKVGKTNLEIEVLE